MPSESRPQAEDLEKLLELLSAGRIEPGNLEQGLEAIALAAIDIFGADLCAVFAFNPVTGHFVSSVCRGEPKDGTTVELATPRPKGLTRKILESNAPIFIDTVKTHRGMSNTFIRQQEIQALAALPLRFRGSGKPLAVVYVDFRRQHVWGEISKELIQLFERQASTLLQSIWFLRRYRKISKVGQAINQKLDGPDSLVRTLEIYLKDVIEAEHCLILGMCSPASPKLKLYGSVSSHQQRFTGEPVEAEGPFLFVLENQESYRSEDFIPDPSQARLGLENPCSVLIAPLQTANEPVGLLIIQHPDAGIYDSEGEQLFQLLANQVSLACSNQRLFNDLERLKKAGEVLTQVLKPEEILSTVVEQIREATSADLVIVYGYSRLEKRFDRQPTVSGKVYTEAKAKPTEVREEDIAWLAVRRSEPVYADDSSELYEKIGGQASRRPGNFEEREKVASTAVVPLKVVDECVGVLFVNYRHRQAFDFGKQQLIEGLSRFAAIAIRNARAFGERAARPLREQEILREVDRRLMRTVNLVQILQQILDLAAEVVSADEASILIYDPKTRRLSPKAAIGKQRKHLRGAYSIDEERGIAVLAFNQRKTIMVGDVRTSEWKDRFISIGGRIHSELDVPMMDGNRPIGVLNFERRKLNSFSEDDRRFLELLAGQAVLAVLRAQDHEAAQRLADERKALIELGNELATQQVQRKIHQLVVAHALKTTRATAGVLVLKDQRRGRLKVVAEQGAESGKLGGFLPRGQGIIGRALKEGKRINVPDVREDPDYVNVVSKTLSELAVPILDKGSPLGVLNIESPQADFFGPEDELLMEALADLALLAIQSAERLRKAQKWSRRLEGLHTLCSKVLEQLDTPDDLMDAVVKLALELTESDCTDLDLYKEGKRSQIFYSCKQEDGRVIVERQSLGSDDTPYVKRGLMDWVAKTLEPFRSTEDAATHPLYEGPGDIHSEMIVPLVDEVDGEKVLVGVLSVESRDHNAFEEEDLTLLKLFAAQAVIAIENAKSYAEARHERKRFRFLFQAGRELAEVPDLRQIDKAYGVVIRMAREHWSCREIVVRQLDPDKKELVFKAVSDNSPPAPFERIPITKGLNGYVARERKAVLVDDARLPPKDGLPAIWRSNHTDRSFAVVPIKFAKQYYGNLALSHTKPGFFDRADLRLIEGLARQLGLTLHRLEQLKATQEAERLAHEDLMMSHAGRRALDATHRLKNDLGWIPNRIVRTQKRMTSGKLEEDTLRTLFEDVYEDVRGVLRRSEEIAEAIQEGRGIQRVGLLVAQLVDDALEGLKIPNGIEVVKRIDRDTGYVRVGYKGITEAVYNLAKNAIEAMTEGGTLTLSTRLVEGMVEIKVSDTGKGIPEELQKKIFEFGRSSKIEKPSGIGLASAQRHVAMDRGDIELQSSGPKGTTFLIRLPASWSH